jgi:hypothetical protein
MLTLSGLVNYSLVDPRLSLRSNPGLKLANAFGVNLWRNFKRLVPLGLLVYMRLEIHAHRKLESAWSTSTKHSSRSLNS